jgi:hypothetical protein
MSTIIHTRTIINSVALERELSDPFETGQLVTFDYSECIEREAISRDRARRHGTDWRIVESHVNSTAHPDGGYVYTRRYEVEAVDSDVTYITDAEWLVAAEDFEGEHELYEPR